MIRRMVAHLEWADARALMALRAAKAPSDEVMELFAHVLGAEHAWIMRIRGVKPEVAVWPELELDAAEALAAANAAALSGLVASMDPVALDRMVSYRTSMGDAFSSSVADILIHVCLHGAYHRGQVALLLRKEDEEPNPTDFIAFTRGAPAAVRR